MDWDSLAERAGFRIDKMAALSGITRQQLRRIFLARFQCNPSARMDQLKLRRAFLLLAKGKSGKEAATAVGFKDCSSLCHFLQRMSRIRARRSSKVMLGGSSAAKCSLKTVNVPLKQSFGIVPARVPP